MLFSTLIKENYKQLKEADNEELQTAIDNVIAMKKFNTYKHASSITDDKFREAVQLIKDATNNKFTTKEIKDALAKELFNLLPESEKLSKSKTLKESHKLVESDKPFNKVMERWYDREVDILPTQYADSYHDVLTSMQEVKEYNYHGDYWGFDDEYQETAEELMLDIEPYIGQTVDYDTDEGTIKIKVLGVDIDKQYNGHLAVRVDIIEEPKQETLKTESEGQKYDKDSFLDQDIQVYNIAKLVEDNIEKDGVTYTTHLGPERALLQDVNGHYILADYEAVRDFAATDSDTISIDVSPKKKEGDHTIQIFPTGTVKFTINDIKQAPVRTMKARDFFEKHNYNPKCIGNFEGLIKNLNGIYQSLYKESETLKENSYEQPLFQEIESALYEAGFNVTRFPDAGLLTNNLGWVVSNSEGEVQLQCNGTYLSDSEKLKEFTRETAILSFELKFDINDAIKKGLHRYIKSVSNLKPKEIYGQIIDALNWNIDEWKSKDKLRTIQYELDSTKPLKEGYDNSTWLNCQNKIEETMELAKSKMEPEEFDDFCEGIIDMAKRYRDGYSL